MKKAKDIEWSSLATFFDARALPDAVPWGRWRYVENIQTSQAGGPELRTGLKRFGSWMRGTNADLHNQLLDQVWYHPNVDEDDLTVTSWPKRGNSRLMSCCK